MGKYTQEDLQQMRYYAAQIRINTVRCMESAKGGHIGGSMSIADVLGVLYGGVMKLDVNQPRMEDRDRLVISKGHCGPAQYAALAVKGFISKEALLTLNQGGTNLPSHCDRNKTPGIDMTTGSLGQGISCACGIASALRIKKNPAYVYAIVGDGELQEGQVWEAIQYAANRKLSNLIVFVDYNKKQLDGRLEEICEPFDLVEKFKAFGCNCCKVKGYDVEEIADSVEACKENKEQVGVIVLDTYKGIGCNFSEAVSLCHFMPITKEMADSAVAEVERRYKLGIVMDPEVQYV